MPKPQLLRLSTTQLGMNKSFPFNSEPHAEQWKTVELTTEQLLEHVYSGRPINTCLFVDGKRGSEYAFGGNIIALDSDDGTTFEEVINLPVVKDYACLVYHSCSSGVHSDKPGNTGIEKLRILLRLEDDVKTNRFTANLETIKNNSEIVHLQRNALTSHLNAQFCEQAGLPKLKDVCNESISQIMYGNSGEGMITPKLPYSPYPCSIDRRFWIGEGYLPQLDMQRITEAYELRKKEDLVVFEGRSAEELSRDSQIARWILENEILDEQVYCEDRTVWLSVVHAAKSIDENLLDALLISGARFFDHYWRNEASTIRCFNEGQSNSRMSVGTLRHWASICDPQWTSRCPYTGGSGNPAPKLSAGLYLLKGLSPTQVII